MSSRGIKALVSMAIQELFSGNLWSLFNKLLTLRRVLLSSTKVGQLGFSRYVLVISCTQMMLSDRLLSTMSVELQVLWSGLVGMMQNWTIC